MIWKDRIKQYSHRYTLTNVSGSTYDFAEVTGAVAEEGTPVNADNLNAIEKELSQKIVKGLPRRLHTKVPLNDKFAAKTWKGLTSFYGEHIWTDGTNIYYSSANVQRVLDVATSTWSVKTWTGLTSFSGSGIWTDGTNIYYSNSADHYVLDTATSTWSVKTWTGLTRFTGEYIWTDGTNIYYSNANVQRVLDTATSTWSVKTWTGLTRFTGEYIWTDGTNIYYSNYGAQYVLDVATSTWSVKTWTGLTSFGGLNIWTDGTNIYYANSADHADQYVLDTATSTWSVKTWTGLTGYFYGKRIWTDGTNIYYSGGYPSEIYYILISSKSIRNWGNPSTIDDLRGINVSVPTSAWAADATYAAYPYRAAVTVTGLTANHTGIINFNDTALALGTLKDGAKTYAGGFYIYASAVPSVTVTIESYVFWEV